MTTFIAVICGAEGWSDVEAFGKLKVNDLRTYLPYQNGIPSDDTFRRFFRVLNPEVFKEKFALWMRTLSLPEQTVIAIDGKVSRHTFDNEKLPLHMVSAFATELNFVLAQTKVSDKSNEITAIPELLSWLDMKGAIITIDAMGTQRTIAETIIEKEADYILALKGNQGTLHEDVRLLFEDEGFLKENGVEDSLSIDAGKGRIEERKCRVIEIPLELQKIHQWPHLKTLIEIQSKREFKNKIEEEKRYYLSSLQKNAKKINHAIRSHWGVENNLHWILDMTFRDDESRIRKGNAPQNMTVIKHAALNLLQANKGKRESIKQLRKMAAWSTERLDAIIKQKF